MKSEFVAASHIVREVLGFCELIKDLEIGLQQGHRLRVVNQATFRQL